MIRCDQRACIGRDGFIALRTRARLIFGPARNTVKRFSCWGCSYLAASLAILTTVGNVLSSCSDIELLRCIRGKDFFLGNDMGSELSWRSERRSCAAVGHLYISIIALLVAVPSVFLPRF